MPVRSRPFVASASLAGSGTQTVYTVPAGRTAIVKAYGAINRAGVAIECRLTVRMGAGSANIAYRAALQPDESLRMPYDELVLGPGDALLITTVGVAAPVPVHIVASGSLLEGEPE